MIDSRTRPNPPALAVSGAMRSLRIGAVVLGLGLLSSGCDAFGISNEITGSVTSKGGELGDFTLSPSSCQSGEHYGFHGADFFKEGDKRSQLRFILDAVKGPVLNVTLPGTTKALVFTTGECPSLAGDVQRQNSTVNNIRNVQGSVKFECKHTGGKGLVKGELTFKNCH